MPVRCRSCKRDDVVYLPGDEQAIFEQGWMLFRDEADILRGYCTKHNPDIADLVRRRLGLLLALSEIQVDDRLRVRGERVT